MSLLVSLGNVIIWTVALCYGYGAVVHVMNMLSLTGFDWLSAPLKWQVLDVVYLILDVIVAVGLFMGWRIAVIAFYIAAISQIILYTVLRTWIIDVPEAFAVSPEQSSYLSGLVVFHIVTLVLLTLSLRLRAQGTRKP